MAILSDFSPFFTFLDTERCDRISKERIIACKLREKLKGIWITKNLAEKLAKIKINR